MNSTSAAALLRLVGLLALLAFAAPLFLSLLSLAGA